MCAISRNLETSVGANSPSTAMLGTGTIGAPATGPRRSTLLTGTAGRTGTGAGGTLLAPRPGGGGGGRVLENLR